MKKFLFGFAFVSSFFTTSLALATEKVQINCDLYLLNEHKKLDATADSPFTKNYLIIDEKSNDQIKQYDAFTNYTDGGAGCFVHGRIGWKMVYDKQKHVELTIINPQAYEELCFDDHRESLIKGRAAYKVSTRIDMNNPPERFLLNLPTPKGINVKGVHSSTPGNNVRFIHLQCHLVK